MATTLTNGIPQNTTSSDFRFSVVRSDDGNATIVLQQLVKVNGVSQWQTATTAKGDAVSQLNAGWDDAIPWAAGTYDLTFNGLYGKNGAYSWRIPGSEVKDRSGILLHEGSQAQPSQALEGCIGATAAFLANAYSVLKAAGEITAATKIPLIVSDAAPGPFYPLHINETVSATTLAPGEAATLTLSLVGNGTANGVSKDIYVHIPATKAGGSGLAAYGSDFQITSADGMVDPYYENHAGSHNGASWPAGEYLLIPAGQQSVTYTITANPNSTFSANELANLTIDNYYVDRELGTKQTDYADSATPVKVLLQGSTLNGKITLTPEQVLTSDHLSGGIQGVVKSYNVRPGDVISYSFQAYTIPDFLSITDGASVYGTGGFVSDLHSGSFTATSNSIVLKVVGSAVGTAWDLDISDAPVSKPATLSSPTSATAMVADAGSDTMNAGTLTGMAIGLAAQAAVAATPLAAALPSLTLVSSTAVSVPASGAAAPVTFQAVAGQKYLVRLVGAELKPVAGALAGGTLKILENGATTPSLTSSGSDLLSEAAALFTAPSNESISVVAGASSATGGSASIEIYNATALTAPIVYLEADPTDQQTRGSDDGINIIVHRTGDLSQAATYKIDINPSGASPVTASDVDGGLLQRSVTFAANEDIATATILPQLSSTPTGDRTATVVLDPASIPAETLANDTLLGLPQSLDITIQDSVAHTATATALISSADASAPASAGQIIFTVNLSVASATSVTLAYITNDVTAVAGTDYTQQSGTLTFAPGEVSKQVTVKLLNPPSGGSDKTFQLNLLSPFGALLPANSTVQTETGTIQESSATSGFSVVDTTTGQPVTAAVQPYSGPVSGIQNQYINLTPDSLNITATTPNWFIHSGNGTDAIDVSKAGGTNVLDGATGSNFLVGGSGNDTFFLDDRAASSNIWSTVVGFHSGDNATIWGITSSDFTVSKTDNQGATGYTGLTFGFIETGKPNANLTLAGYTTTDLANGRLSVTYGKTQDTPGLAGSAYMLIQGN